MGLSTAEYFSTTNWVSFFEGSATLPSRYSPKPLENRLSSSQHDGRKCRPGDQDSDEVLKEIRGDGIAPSHRPAISRAAPRRCRCTLRTTRALTRVYPSSETIRPARSCFPPVRSGTESSRDDFRPGIPRSPIPGIEEARAELLGITTPHQWPDHHRFGISHRLRGRCKRLLGSHDKTAERMTALKILRS